MSASWHRVRRMGEHALLVETGSLVVSHRLDALLRAAIT